MPGDSGVIGEALRARRQSTGVMQALRIEQPWHARLIEVPVPVPGPHDVVARVDVVGICGSDVAVLEGRRPAAFVRYPVVPGHEWSGTVESVGTAVTTVMVGDAVVAEGFRACGRCARCCEGHTNLCSSGYEETGFTHSGAFAELVCVPERLVHRLPPGIDRSAAAVLEPAACVAQGLLEVNLRSGLEIAVVGSGTLGLLAVAMLSLYAPSRLSLVGTRSSRLELGRALGATEVCNAREVGAVEDLAGQFDLVFEAVGQPQGTQSALRLARRGGTVVLEGVCGQPGGADADAISLSHLRVQGVFGASRRAWLHAIGLVVRGDLDPSPLVTHLLPLESWERAFALLSDPTEDAIKVQLTPL